MSTPISRLAVTVATACTVGALTLGSAQAAPPPPPARGGVDVAGRVLACGPSETPRSIEYHSTRGDQGSMPVGPGGTYRIHLRAIGPWWQGGGWMGGTVDCAGPRPTHYIRRIGFRPFPLARPAWGTTAWHDIR